MNYEELENRVTALEAEVKDLKKAIMTLDFERSAFLNGLCNIADSLSVPKREIYGILKTINNLEKTKKAGN